MTTTPKTISAGPVPIPCRGGEGGAPGGSLVDPAAALLADAARAGCAPAATAKRFPPIVSAADFCAAPMDAPPEVIEGVLHRGGKGQYGGPSKSNKTWCLLDLCLAVANGTDWLGFPTAQGPVLYINLELQGFAVNRRLRAIAEARGLAIPPHFRLWNLRGYGCPMPELMPDLMAHIGKEQYSLIVPDPIYKTLAGRNENDAGDMALLMGELEQVAVQSGAAVMWGAHFAKGSAAMKASIDRVAGSGVTARDPDALITATPHEAENAFTVEMTLRNFPQPAPFVIEWEYPLMRRAGHLDPKRLRMNTGRPPTHTREDVLKVLHGPATATEWCKAAAEDGISRTTFYRLKKEAAAAGDVLENLSGQWEKSQKSQKSRKGV